MTGLDGRLLDLLQDEFPAVPRPYAELARRHGSLSEAEVHAAVTRWRSSGMVRRLGGVFDSRALGYHTTLVAAEVAPENLARVAAAVGAYPEVTHSYAREGRLNLWFALVVPEPGRVAAILGKLEKTTGVTFHDLPADRVYKTEVKFRFGAAPGPPGPGRPDGAARQAGAAGPADPAGGRVEAASTRPEQPDDADRLLIAALAGDFPPGLEPYEELAARLGMTSSEVLDRIAGYRRRGWLRRLAGVLAHRKAGVRGNAMVVWEVAQESLDRAGRALASFPEVTHCYARPPLAGWPYRLYSMVHAPTRRECRRRVRALGEAVNLLSYQILFSTREYKKTSPRYFDPDGGSPKAGPLHIDPDGGSR